MTAHRRRIEQALFGSREEREEAREIIAELIDDNDPELREMLGGSPRARLIARLGLDREDES